MPWRQLWTCVSMEVSSSLRAIITFGKHMGVGAQGASFSDTCLLRSTLGTWEQSEQLNGNPSSCGTMAGIGDRQT